MNKHTHAGGVVVRRRGNVAEVLLVTAKNRPDQWVLPKGHIDDGESAAEAALREVMEECGVIGKILANAGESSYAAKGANVSSVFYLMEYVSEVETTEGRRLRWCDHDEALELLSFEDSCAIIRRALAIYAELGW